MSTNVAHATDLCDADILSCPVELPCGRVVPNRLVKSALNEHLGQFRGGPPNNLHNSLYARWAQGGWGMVITGNAQVSPTHLSLGRDTIALPRTSHFVQSWRSLAIAMRGASTEGSTRPLSIVQLSHAGRQSPRFIGGRLPWSPALAPSAKRLGSDSTEGLVASVFYRVMFNSARAMTTKEINEVIHSFVSAAMLAFESGFDGVQLHAAHGYLLAQFMSPKTNLRRDVYGSNITLLRDIVFAIRASVPPTFVLGVKLNAGDYVKGGLSEDQALKQVREISQWELVDFIEISGGDYETPEFAKSASPRQAFFSRFSRRAVQSLLISPKSPVILLTGSLRTREQLAGAVRDSHAHLLGIGRPSIISPSLAHLLLTSTHPPDMRLAPTFLSLRWIPKLVNASMETIWYTYGIRLLARGRNVDIQTGMFHPLLNMYLWEVGMFALALLIFVIMLTVQR